MVQIRADLNRVSVLDLDNTIRFDRDIHRQARKHLQANLPSGDGTDRDRHPLVTTKRCRYCISLHDVSWISKGNPFGAMWRISEGNLRVAPRRFDGQTLATMLADQIGS